MISAPEKNTAKSSASAAPKNNTFFKGSAMETEAENEAPFFPPVQAKAAVNKPGDEFEKEADHTADHVMRKPAQGVQRKCQDCDEAPVVQRKISTAVQAKCKDCEEQEKTVQAKTNNSPAVHKPASPPKSFAQQLNQSRNGGTHMNGQTAEFMANRFNADFSKVKLHTDENAAAMSNQINAQAFTSGENIYFNNNKFNPHTDEGKHLLAHELTHTIQQGAASQKTEKPAKSPAKAKKEPAVKLPADKGSKKDLQNEHDKITAFVKSNPLKEAAEKIDPEKQIAMPGAAAEIINEGKKGGKEKKDGLQNVPGASQLANAGKSAVKDVKKDAGKEKQDKEKKAGEADDVMAMLLKKQAGAKQLLSQKISFKATEKEKNNKAAVANREMADSHAATFNTTAAAQIQSVIQTGLAAHPLIKMAASAAKINLQSNSVQQQAKITAEIAKLTKQAKAKAGSAFGTINKNYQTATTAANKTADDAKTKLKQSYDTELKNLEDNHAKQLPKLDGFYNTCADNYRKAGVTAGDYAVTRANDFASANYDPYVTGEDDNLLDGPYTSDQYEARAKAAREVGKQYRDAEKGLVNEGKNQADELLKGPGKGEDLKTLNDNTQKSREALKKNYDSAISSIDATLKQTLDQAKKSKDALMKSASATLKATLKGLTEQQKGLLAQVSGITEAQLQNIDKEAMQSLTSLSQAVMQTADSLLKGVADFKQNARENEAPDAKLLQNALLANTKGFTTSTTGINVTFTKAARSSATSLTKSAALTVNEIVQLATQGLEQANEIYNGLPPVMSQLISNAVSTFKQITKSHTQSTNDLVTNTTTGFQNIAEGINKYFEAYYKSLEEGLKKSSENKLKSFMDAVDAPDFVKSMKDEAEKAADEVSPRWKSVLKILLVIVVVVLVALVVGPAVIGFVTAGAAALGAGAAAATIGAVVGGAIVGAAAGAVIQMGNNLIDGKPIMQGVAKAAIIGAISGALGGAGGALGQFITKGAQGFAPALIRFGVDMAFDVGGNIAIEAYEAFKEGRPMNWGEIAKGAAISAGMSIGMSNMNKLGKFGSTVEGIQGKSMKFGENLGGKAGGFIKAKISVDTDINIKAPSVEAPEVKVDSPTAKPATEPGVTAPKADTPEAGVKPAADAPSVKPAEPEVHAPKPDADGKIPKPETDAKPVKTEAETKAPAADVESKTPKTEPEAKVGQDTEPHGKKPVADDGSKPKTETEIKEKETKMQNDEDVVAKEKTEDGHDLKVDKEGNVAHCTECKVYELSHKEKLDANPELKSELQDIRKQLTVDPEDPAALAKLKEFDQKMKEIDSFDKAKTDLLNNQAEIDSAYADYKSRKGPNARKQNEWLKGKQNPNTGKSKGGFENTLKGRIGEAQADMHLNDTGYKKLSNNGELIDYNNPPQGKGFDGIWQKNGEFYINETKFGTGKLTSLQKKNSWIQDNINKIPDPKLKADVQAAFDAGKLNKIVTHVDTNGVVSIKPWQ